MMEFVLAAFPPVLMVTDTIAHDPLMLPLRQYALFLGAALLGGFVSWLAKIRRGELPVGSLSAMIGELATSAFAGLITFWGCAYLQIDLNLTACLVGLAGHAGGRAIYMIESYVKSKVPQLPLFPPGK